MAPPDTIPPHPRAMSPYRGPLTLLATGSE